jgi:hypothetical protein
LAFSFCATSEIEVDVKQQHGSCLFPFYLFLPLLFREEHIARKMEQMVQEAKAKMAKGDKKGKSCVKDFEDA